VRDTVKRIHKISAAAIPALMMAVMFLTPCAAATTEFKILNPYESVDWAWAKPYRTQLHTHTTASDGRQTMAEAIESYCQAGYGFLAITDHGVVDRSWTRPNYIPFSKLYSHIVPLHGKRRVIQGLSEARLREIVEGAGRGGRGMLRVPFGIEQNPQGKRVELNSWFCDWGNFVPGGNYEYEFGVRNVHRRGGLSVINHPSNARYNKGMSLEEIYEGENNAYVNKIQVLLEQYPSLLGIELRRSASDVKLWDTLLANLAPAGRNVFGFATSDSHGEDTIGQGWVWALMEEQTVANLRGSLEAGAFFAGLRRAGHPEPMVTKITVNTDTISVEAENHEAILWISNGKVIATGGELSLSGHLDRLGAYVRAEVRGEGGTLCTQPFLLSYGGMPAGRPVPAGYKSDGRLYVILRSLLYPFVRVIDLAWKAIYYCGKKH